MEGLKERRGPSLAVDVVIVRRDGSIVLIRRLREPFRGMYAIPGGFVEYGERVEEAAVREAREETGLEVELVGLVGIYSDPSRDPRGHVVSVAYLAREAGGELRAGDDAKEVACFKPRELPRDLAFDHANILKDALKLAEREGLIRG